MNKSSKRFPLLFLLLGVLLSDSILAQQTAMHTTDAIEIDGSASDPAWATAPWYPLDQSLLGPPAEATDFSGRYKVLWSKHRLYVLAELVDDVLVDSSSHPFERYWEDDTFEVFIDEDASGGDHHKNHNAFAYHFALDNRVVDIGESGDPIDLTANTLSQWRRTADGLTWEVAITIYDDSFKEESANKAVNLKAGHEMGFMVAYCDADSARGREHFYNSVDIKAKNGDKNLGYLDASVFGRLRLLEK